MFTGATSKTGGQKGRPRADGQTKGTKKRKAPLVVEVEEGFIVDLTDEGVAKSAAAKALKQNQVRQKKKPARFGDVQPPDAITPRTGQV